MKVALVFTGLLRCFDLAYPSIKREFLDKYNPDVFFDIWSDSGYYSGKGYLQQPNDQYVKIAEGDKGFHESGRVNVEQIYDLYNPISVSIQNFNFYELQFENWVKSFTNAYTRPKNTAAMFYKISRGIFYLPTSITQPEYDLVIRMRPDLILNSSFPDLSPEKFYTIRHSNKNGRGTGDGLQIGSLNNMRNFAQTYGNLKRLYTQLQVSCPHLFTETMIRYFNMPWEELNIEFVTMHSPAGPYQEIQS